MKSMINIKRGKKHKWCRCCQYYKRNINLGKTKSGTRQKLKIRLERVADW